MLASWCVVATRQPTEARAAPGVMVRARLGEGRLRRQRAERYDPDEVQRWLGYAVAVPQLDVGATTVRHRIASGDDVRGLVQPTVLAYIHEHGLYG